MNRSTLLSHLPARWRRILAHGFGWLPGNGLRVRAFRLLGHTLPRGTRIGIGTVIACDALHAGKGVTICRGNRFSGPFTITIGDGAFIGRHNRFDCGDVAACPSKAAMGYARQMQIGADVLIHERHFFDVYGKITIGDGTWIAGCDSQFWTHGASAMDRDVAIGHGCYLGAAVRMAPGSAIADRCVLGIASVVVSRLNQPDTVLGGFPARPLREIRPEDSRQFAFTMDGWR